MLAQEASCAGQLGSSLRNLRWRAKSSHFRALVAQRRAMKQPCRQPEHFRESRVGAAGGPLTQRRRDRTRQAGAPHQAQTPLTIRAAQAPPQRRQPSPSAGLTACRLCAVGLPRSTKVAIPRQGAPPWRIATARCIRGSCGPPGPGGCARRGLPPPAGASALLLGCSCDGAMRCKTLKRLREQESHQQPDVPDYRAHALDRVVPRGRRGGEQGTLPTLSSLETLCTRHCTCGRGRLGALPSRPGVSHAGALPPSLEAPLRWAAAAALWARTGVVQCRAAASLVNRPQACRRPASSRTGGCSAPASPPARKHRPFGAPLSPSCR